MDPTLILTGAGIIIFIGFFGEYVFQKTNIPDVVWLMFLGIGLGFVFDIKSNPAFTTIAPIFTTFALLFILFEGAINIDIKKLVKGLEGGTKLSLFSFLLSLIIVPLVMMIIGWSFMEGLLLGAIVGGASSAVIIPMTKKLDIKPNTALMLTFESAISDVLCIVGAVTFLDIIILQYFSIGTIIQQIVYSFLLAIGIGIIAVFVWLKILKHLEKISRSYITTIATLILVYTFVQFLDSNGAIAALAFGIVTGNSKKIFSVLSRDNSEYSMTTSAKFFFSEISFVVKTLFFVYLGLLLDLSNLKLLLIGFLLTVLLFIVRPVAVSLRTKNDIHLKDKDKIFMEILTPKGLAAAVLAQLPLQAVEKGAIIPHAGEFSTVVLSIIMFSILISTVGVFATEKGKFRGIKGLVGNVARRYLKD